MKDKSKLGIKSGFGFGRKRMHLIQKVVTLEEARILYERNILALGLVLAHEDFEQMNRVNQKEGLELSKRILTYYNFDALPVSNDVSVYLGINQERLEQDAMTILYLDEFIDKKKKIKYVERIYPHNEEKPTRIGIVKERTLFQRKKDIELFSIDQLLEQAISEYKREDRKHRVLREEEIKEIHARGNLTPYEKAQEWAGFDLCPSGTAIGSVRNRCHEFNNCFECLYDYACEKEEHEPVFSHVKIVNSYLPSEEEQKATVKKIGEKK